MYNLSSGDGQTDWSYQTYFVNGVVNGIAFQEGDEVGFELASISISTLPKWANPNVGTLDSAQGEAGTQRANLKIVERPDETITVVDGGQEIRISLRYRPKVDVSRGRHGAITRYLVEHHCQLEMERSDGSKMPLESLRSVTETMRDLLAICCNETPTVNSIFALCHKGTPPVGKVFFKTRGIDRQGKKSHPYPAIVLKDLGGLGGLAAWFRVREQYGELVARLTSNWYNDKAYIEDRFNRMYAAVEGLLSKKQERNRATMTARELSGFVEDAIPGFSSVTNRHSEEWAEQAKDIRDQRISHSDPTSTVDADGLTILVMANVLYVAGASFLLGEIEVGEDQIHQFIKDCQGALLLSE